MTVARADATGAVWSGLALATLVSVVLWTTALVVMFG